MVIEVLNAAQAVDSLLVNKVLSYVTHSFDKGSSEESEVRMFFSSVILNALSRSKTTEILFIFIVQCNHSLNCRLGQVLGPHNFMFRSICAHLSISCFVCFLYRVNARIQEQGQGPFFFCLVYVCKKSKIWRPHHY